MTLSKQSRLPPAKTTPPLLIGLAGLLIAVGFACFLGLTAIQNEKSTREAVGTLQSMWGERIKSHSYADQDKAEIDVQQDRLKLAQITDSYRQLYQLISICAGGLVIFSLLCFLAFRFGLLLPLRKLERSSRALLENDLNGHIWGLDRKDAFGSLARSISNIRKATVNMADMVIATDTGEQHVRFEGNSGALFQTLITELKKTVENLTQHSATLETVSKDGQESIQELGEVATRQTRNLEDALASVNAQISDTTHYMKSTIVDASNHINEALADTSKHLTQTLADTTKHLTDTLADTTKQMSATIGDASTQINSTTNEWGDKLSTLFHQNNQIQGQSKQIVDQFTRDMQSLNQIAGATGARVAQTLQLLSTSDRDIKKAAAQSLEASTTFGNQAKDLTEKLQSATNLLRASGKVMSETTETARTRLNEAINSVSSHDQAIRAFLGDTEEKTDRITSLLEDVSRSAVQAASTMSTFDGRMALFEEKSNTAFHRIDESGDAIGKASTQLNDVHGMMQGSLESMNGHTEMLARILISIRDEYASFSNEWKTNIAETAPIFSQLKDSSDTLQTQLRDEWSVYAQQSRQLLVSLEQDVRAMNTRTELVTQDTEKLLSGLSTQTQRISDNANNFDLQIANISLRIDDATTSILRGNKDVVETTKAQIETIHGSVQDMAQRLSILSQLTGTLGAVAGQLGQIVPTLGDAQRMRAPTGFAAPAGNDPEMLLRFEEINASFSNTLGSVKTEFDGVREQIGRWVAMLTDGYKNLAEQINSVDGSIDTKINALKEQVESATAAQISAAAAVAKQAATPPPVPTINLGEELVPAMRLIHEGLEKGYAIDGVLSSDLQQLKRDLQSMAKDVSNTTNSLQNLGALVETGFDKLEEQDNTPVNVVVDASRVETAAQALDALMRKLQGHSDTVVGKLGDITQRLEGTSNKLNAVRVETAGTPSEVPAARYVPSPSIELSEKANLDQLHQQIENISTMLDRFSSDGTGFINPMGQTETLTPDKSKAFIETVMATIIRLHHIAESIEKIGGTTPPGDSDDSKTG